MSACEIETCERKAKRGRRYCARHEQSVKLAMRASGYLTKDDEQTIARRGAESVGRRMMPSNSIAGSPAPGDE